jgi:hypothetical protein
MNFFYKILLLVTFFALFIFVSCEDEQIDDNLLNQVETILPNSELATMIEDVASVEVFECVAFQYPISFSLYNPNFQILETITINSDSELLSFWENLNNSTTNVVLVSLNFPVTLIYDNDISIAVQNNQELEAALTAASDNCDDSPACDLEAVINYLTTCSQIPTLNTFTPSFTEFEFSENNDLFTMYELDLPYSGVWDITIIEGEVVVFINFNGLEDYNGQWVVVSCSENSLVMMQDNDTLTLTQSCDTDDPLACFSSFEAQMTLCDENNDGIETFNLTQVFANCTPNDSYNLLYYESLADAQSSSNQIPNPESFTNTSNPQTIYVKVEFEGTLTSDVYEIQLLLEECNNSGCNQEQVNAFLLECEWNVVYFNGSDDLMFYNMDFESSGIVVIYNDTITIDATWSLSTTASGVVINFSNVAGPNIQAISGSWLVVECEEHRLEFHNTNNDVMVIERTCD